MRLVLLATSLLGVAACQCGFVPVAQCEGAACTPDAGAVDGGMPSVDAGPPREPDTCPEWDGGRAGVGFCFAEWGFRFTPEGCRSGCWLADSVELDQCVERCSSRCFPSKLLGPTDAGCGLIVVQTLAPAALAGAFPAWDGGCVDVGGDRFRCTLGPSFVGEAGAVRRCQATLIPSVETVECAP